MNIERDYHLENRDELLSDLYEGLKRCSTTHIDYISIGLYVSGMRVKETNLIGFLDIITNDLYWDEDADWATADELRVELL